MKRKITVTFEMEPTEYFDAEDSEKGAVDLAMAMLNREADLPYETMEISCGSVTEKHTFETLVR
jgi:hypothetical protein